MSTLDAYEREVFETNESDKLKPMATKAELLLLRAAARATAIKNRRVNIRLSSIELHAIQAKALDQGLPYQTQIASVLLKYVSGKLVENEPSLPGKQRRPTRS